MAILQSPKNLVTSDLKKRYGDLWLFGALERKQVRKPRSRYAGRDRKPERGRLADDGGHVSL